MSFPLAYSAGILSFYHSNFVIINDKKYLKIKHWKLIYVFAKEIPKLINNSQNPTTSLFSI